MRAKLTWRYRRWSEGGIVEPLAGAFRQRHGDAAADAVERMRDLLRNLSDEPSTQDVKATIRALANSPADADLTRLDTDTNALLLKHSWKMFRVPHIAALTLDQVAECARAALADMPAANGRPATQSASLMLAADLLPLLPSGTKPAARDMFLKSALQECGLGSSPRIIKALLSQLAKRHAKRARAAPPPASPWHAVLQQLEAPHGKARKMRGRRAG